MKSVFAIAVLFAATFAIDLEASVEDPAVHAAHEDADHFDQLENVIEAAWDTTKDLLVDKLNSAEITYNESFDENFLENF